MLCYNKKCIKSKNLLTFPTHRQVPNYQRQQQHHVLTARHCAAWQQLVQLHALLHRTLLHPAAAAPLALQATRTRLRLIPLLSHYQPLYRHC